MCGPDKGMRRAARDEYGLMVAGKREGARPGAVTGTTISVTSSTSPSSSTTPLRNVCPRLPAMQPGNTVPTSSLRRGTSARNCVYAPSTVLPRGAATDTKGPSQSRLPVDTRAA